MKITVLLIVLYVVIMAYLVVNLFLRHNNCVRCQQCGRYYHESPDMVDYNESILGTNAKKVPYFCSLSCASV